MTVQIIAGEFAYIHAAQFDLATVQSMKAQQQFDQRTLTAAARPHYPYPLARRQREAKVLMDTAPGAGVGKNDVIKVHAGAQVPRHRPRDRRGLDRRAGIQYAEDTYPRGAHTTLSIIIDGNPMQRSISGFYPDPEHHWVAQLDCHHGQHLRHQPPFVSRPWTQTHAGREAMLGTMLDCLKCERLKLPVQLSVYQTTAPFDENSIPAGLLREHATKAGIWGRIQVDEGILRYVVTAPFQTQRTLHAGDSAPIAPQVLHPLEPVGKVKVRVEFLR